MEDAMKKRLILVTALVSLVMAVASIQAAVLKCSVEKVEGNVVTLNCDEKADALSVGTEVKVKTVKAKTTAIEGC